MKIAALIIIGLLGVLDTLLVLGSAKLEKMRNDRQPDED